MTLQDFFLDHPKAAVAFSGGTDSACLLRTGRLLGADLKAYFIRTPFQPAFELEDARRLDPDLTVIEMDILQDTAVASNQADRCYHCKKRLFSALQKAARADGYEVLLDGTNASDRPEERPGMQALKELGVLSPLRLCGLDKAAVRAYSRELGLFTWDKPAYACLATRIPTGMPIDAPVLRRVEEAEGALMALGYRDLRIRLDGDAAKLQLKKEQFPTSEEEYKRIQAAVSFWFDTIILDPKGR